MSPEVIQINPIFTARENNYSDIQVPGMAQALFSLCTDCLACNHTYCIITSKYPHTANSCIQRWNKAWLPDTHLWIRPACFTDVSFGSRPFVQGQVREIYPDHILPGHFRARRRIPPEVHTRKVFQLFWFVIQLNRYRPGRYNHFFSVQENWVSGTRGG